MLTVPGDRLGKAGFEIRMRRAPAELPTQLRCVDCATAVMTGAVGDQIERIRGLAQLGKDRPYDLEVAPLAVRADDVALPRPAACEDCPDGGAVVVHVNPVAHVAAVAVELRSLAAQDERDGMGDELLGMLARPVVVHAVGDGRVEAVRAHPRAHEHVARRLG